MRDRLVIFRDAEGIEEDKKARCYQRALAKQRARRSHYRAKFLKRIPKWASRESILKFYETAKQMTKATGIKHEVDHIIPLLGELVSGLHVAENLQVIPMLDNRKKSNRFDIDGAR